MYICTQHIVGVGGVGVKTKLLLHKNRQRFQADVNVFVSMAVMSWLCKYC